MNALLIRSGVPMVQAINLSSQILKNSVISTILQKGAKKVVEGSKLSSALASEGETGVDEFVRWRLPRGDAGRGETAIVVGC